MGIFDPRKLCLANSLFPTEINEEVEAFIRKMLESDSFEQAEETLANHLPDMLSECPGCHYTLEQYEETGMLGCPECYKAFLSDLREYAAGEAAELVSYTPAEPELMVSPALELGRLELLLQDAVRAENYEEAARLRDRIKQLMSHDL